MSLKSLANPMLAVLVLMLFASPNFSLPIASNMFQVVMRAINFTKFRIGVALVCAIGTAVANVGHNFRHQIV